MYKVYVLKSLLDRKYYTGYSSDVNRRLVEHNSGKTKSTRRRHPFELIYSEQFQSEDEVKKT
jgi:putative endonuclease